MPEPFFRSTISPCKAYTRVVPDIRYRGWKMKIVAFEVEGWEKQQFEPLQANHEVLFTENTVNEDLPADFLDADIISVFIYSSLDAETLSKFRFLKLIVTRSTGYNHIDLDYCRQHNISVSNDPSYGPSTVAEHVFALIHAISRHIPEAVERTRRGDFSIKGLRGFDLRGKTLGVIGTGDIGINVIKIARGYDMEVVAFDVRPDHEKEKKMGFHYLDMDTLLGSSDIITLHVPGIEQTRNMIDAPQFDRMKKGVVIINTARGSIINAQALLKALHEGKVGGAGIDVLNSESSIREETELLRSVFSKKGDCPDLLMDMILADMPNVIVTPHIAFDTIEAVERLLKTGVDNILSFIEGHQQNVIVGSRPDKVGV